SVNAKSSGDFRFASQIPTRLSGISFSIAFLPYLVIISSSSRHRSPLRTLLIPAARKTLRRPEPLELVIPSEWPVASRFARSRCSGVEEHQVFAAHLARCQKSVHLGKAAHGELPRLTASALW